MKTTEKKRNNIEIALHKKRQFNSTDCIGQIIMKIVIIICNNNNPDNINLPLYTIPIRINQIYTAYCP